MREETYDIPGYQFGLMIPSRDIYVADSPGYEAEFNRCEKMGNANIVPFENVDGLTVDEVTKVMKQPGFAFVCYTNWQELMKTSISNHFYLHYKCIFTPDFLKQNMLLRVDKLIENHLTYAYTITNDIGKKVCKCFFERYQDKDYQKTGDRVKKL